MFLGAFPGPCWASTGQLPEEPKIPVRVRFFGYPLLRVLFSPLIFLDSHVRVNRDLTPNPDKKQIPAQYQMS